MPPSTSLEFQIYTYRTHEEGRCYVPLLLSRNPTAPLRLTEWWSSTLPDRPTYLRFSRSDHGSLILTVGLLVM